MKTECEKICMDLESWYQYILENVSFGVAGPCRTAAPFYFIPSADGKRSRIREREKYMDQKKEEAIIRLEGLGKQFATSNGTVTALNDINLEIRRGEIFGIIGLSGAGKSTLVRCINYLEEPTSAG